MNTTKLELISERLIMRPMLLDDAGAIFKYRSDSNTNKYQGWIPTSIDEVRTFIKDNISPVIDIAETWFQMVIIKKSSHELIGDIGIHFLDQENYQLEIGCTLNKSEHGNGYAIEALKEIISYMFTKLNKHRIITSIDPDNTKSVALVERLGFRKEAHFIKSLWWKGEWVDDLVYAMLKEEWIKKQL